PRILGCGSCSFQRRFQRGHYHIAAGGDHGGRRRPSAKCPSLPRVRAEVLLVVRALPFEMLPRDGMKMESQPPDRGHAALKALRAIARFCDQAIGWSRIGFLISISIIAIAAVALYRHLRDIEISEVIAALRETDPNDFAVAAVCVAGGYFTLTFYDLFALRTIGRPDIPYRIAALAGFTSYSIGHNIGASVLTGGAVRYRIYSVWGLDAIAVAKVCFVAGLTFWLGNATVLGLGISYAPQAASAIDQLPAWFNRAGAIVTLIVLATYIGWVWRRPRVIGRSGWRVTLPGGPLTLLQIGIGIVDLAFCAL